MHIITQKAYFSHFKAWPWDTMYKVKVTTQNAIFDHYEPPNDFSRHLEHCQNLNLNLTLWPWAWPFKVTQSHVAALYKHYRGKHGKRNKEIKKKKNGRETVWCKKNVLHHNYQLQRHLIPCHWYHYTQLKDS